MIAILLDADDVDNDACTVNKSQIQSSDDDDDNMCVVKKKPRKVDTDVSRAHVRHDDDYVNEVRRVSNASHQFSVATPIQPVATGSRYSGKKSVSATRMLGWQLPTSAATSYTDRLLEENNDLLSKNNY